MKNKSAEPIKTSYLDAEEHIINAVDSIKASTAREWLDKFNKDINDVFKGIDKENKKFAKEEIPKAYAQGVKRATLGIEIKGKENIKPSNKSWQRASRNAYIELNSGVQEATKRLKATVKSKLTELEKTNSSTVLNLKEEIKKSFQEEGVLKVTYKNGNNVDLSAYANMIARSNRIETSNTGCLNAAKELGTDLVKCTTVPNTCEICAKYQGRVYSVSGKDTRFPSLYEGANAPLNHGYKLIHPNCRHQFLPYFEELQTKEDFEKDTKNSNKPFNDVRSDRERKAYQEWQRFNRQRWDEQQEYIDMKGTLGEKMPYKTLGGFRRARRAKSKEYLDVNYKHNSINYIKQQDIDIDIEKDYTLEDFRYIKISAMRQKRLKDNPELALPNANNVEVDDRKFTEYIFKDNTNDGKGKNFEHRLGYNKNNYAAMKKEILDKSKLFPAVLVKEDKYGKSYEQSVILHGINNNPTNVTIGWKSKDNKTWMSTAYITNIKGDKN